MKKLKTFYELFPDSYIQTFDDKKTGNKAVINLFPISELKDKFEHVKSLNGKGAGVFFTSNPCKGGRKQENVTSIKWVYADLDEGTKEEMMARIAEAPIQPHMIIESKRSYHIYWRCDISSQETFKRIAKGLIKFFNGDPAVLSTSQALRLPGFMHMKGDPFKVKLLVLDEEEIVHQEKMIDAYPYIEPPRTPAKFNFNSYDGDDDMETIKNIDIRQVLNWLNVEYNNKNVVLEEGKETSMHINVKENYAHRFSCKGGSGTTIDVAMEYGNMELNEAIAWLKEKAGIEKKPRKLDVSKLLQTNNTSSEEFLPQKKRGIKPFTWGTAGTDREISPIERHHFIIFAGKQGSGKCLGKGTKIVMGNGRLKCVEDVVSGDVIMGDDSTTRNVTSIATGSEQMYWIRQKKGIDYRVNESHILSLVWSGGKRDGEKKDICVRDFIKLSKWEKSRWKGYNNGFDLPYVKQEISPYFLGLWLGDGTTRSVAISVNPIDTEIIEFLASYAKELGLKLHEYTPKNRCPTYSINTGVRGNPRKPSLQKTMSEIGVIGNKHIPDNFMYASREQRLSLLAGLMDSDGYLSKSHYEITQKRESLIKQIKQLADSLGFKTHLRKKIAKIKSVGFSCTVYRLTIMGDTFLIPCKVKRKINQRQCKTRVNQTRTGIFAEVDSVDKYYGFTIDGNHRFLLEDGTVTHNTGYTFDMAIKNAKLGHKVLYVSLEMESNKILERIARGYAKITKLQWRDESYAEWQRVAANKRYKELTDIKELKAVGFPAGVDKSTEAIQELITECEPDIVFIDNFDLISVDDKDQISRENKLGKFFMDFTNKRNIPIIVLHHVKKNGDGGIDSIRGSGKITDDCDTAVMCFREEGAETPEEKAALIIAQKKDRDFGDCGSSTTYFHKGGFIDSFEMYDSPEVEELLSEI